MSIAPLRQEDLKVLDQARQRLFQLSNNIKSLRLDVQQGNPLPPWASIQNTASILSHNVNGLVEHLSKNSETLNRTVAYPSTNYPGRTQEGILGQLLRKKHEPQVETWVDQGRAESTESPKDDAEDLWNWASGWIGPRVAKYVMEAGDDYTFDEREAGIENVRTGLRQKFGEDESDEDDEDDEDEEMEDINLDISSVEKPSTNPPDAGKEDAIKRAAGPKRTLDDALRVLNTGVILTRK